MKKLSNIQKDSNARSEITTALDILRKHDVFSALLWRGTVEVKGSFGSDDISKTALAGAMSAGYKQALQDINTILTVREDDTRK